MGREEGKVDDSLETADGGVTTKFMAWDEISLRGPLVEMLALNFIFICRRIV